MGAPDLADAFFRIIPDIPPPSRENQIRLGNPAGSVQLGNKCHAFNGTLHHGGLGLLQAAQLERGPALLCSTTRATNHGQNDANARESGPKYEKSYLARPDVWPAIKSTVVRNYDAGVSASSSSADSFLLSQPY